MAGARIANGGFDRKHEFDGRSGLVMAEKTLLDGGREQGFER